MDAVTRPFNSGWLLATSIVVAFLSVVPAHACVICLPYPKETGADVVIKSETVVFARENPSRALSYLPVETIKGEYDGRAIPLLVDSTTSSALRLDPALRVALAEDRPSGTWKSLGLVDVEYAALLREIARWTAPLKSPSERADFFAPYLLHEDRELAELAFLEVARAPYAKIREIRTRIGRDDIYRVVNDFFHTEWHGLYILMLGMSDRPDDIAFVRGKLDAAARFGLTTNLGAYATTLIEMVGADAIEQLAQDYFTNPGRSADELREVVKALSVHGSGGRIELRGAIVEAYGRLLSQHPQLAGYVANDLFDWEVTGFERQMRAILDAGVDLDGASQLAVATYLSSKDQVRPGGPGAITAGRRQ